MKPIRVKKLILGSVLMFRWITKKYLLKVYQKKRDLCDDIEIELEYSNYSLDKEQDLVKVLEVNRSLCMSLLNVIKSI